MSFGMVEKHDFLTFSGREMQDMISGELQHHRHMVRNMSYDLSYFNPTFCFMRLGIIIN